MSERCSAGGRRGAKDALWGAKGSAAWCLPWLSAPAAPAFAILLLTSPVPDCNDALPQVFILPTIRINGVQYRGKMATTEVLRAICAGFTTGNMPQACNKVGFSAASSSGPVGPLAPRSAHCRAHSLFSCSGQALCSWWLCLSS